RRCGQGEVVRRLPPRARARRRHDGRDRRGRPPRPPGLGRGARGHDHQALRAPAILRPVRNLTWIKESAGSTRQRTAAKTRGAAPMSEMVMVVPVIVLTGVVLVGILSVFRNYMAQRDRLDAEFLREHAAAEKK